MLSVFDNWATIISTLYYTTSHYRTVRLDGLLLFGILRLIVNRLDICRHTQSADRPSR